MSHPAFSFWIGLALQLLEQLADGAAWCFHQFYELGRLVADVRRRRRRAQLRRITFPADITRAEPWMGENPATVVRRILHMNGLERAE